MQVYHHRQAGSPDYAVSTPGILHDLVGSLEEVSF
jgi:hypothetical protein